MITNSKTIQVEESRIRLDVYLQKISGKTWSRNFIQKIIKEKKITIIDSNHIAIPVKKIKPSFLVSKGMIIHIPEIEENMNSFSIEPIPMELNIIYEDPYLAVIHKPAGISVHPGPNQHQTITLLHGILHQWKELQKQTIWIQNHSIQQRPGLVHRLDKMTEGLLLIAKNPSTQWKLSKLFQTRQIEKIYIAWLFGVPPQNQGRIELPIARHPENRMKMRVDPAGRIAITEYKILRTIHSSHHRKYTKVQIHLITGRTHQIRAHFHHLKCPVAGDDLYYKVDAKIKKYGLLLLAKKISFIHPENQKFLSFEIPEPERFIEFEKKCGHY